MIREQKMYKIQEALSEFEDRICIALVRSKLPHREFRYEFSRSTDGTYRLHVLLADPEHGGLYWNTEGLDISELCANAIDALSTAEFRKQT